ncbi:MAG: UDP-N-acetylmuramoyl-tripeptide--D-alanyl-D-alanine ligase [Pseudomonadota bacterium]
MSALWRWPELCQALGLAPQAGPDITGISIDSRTIRPGELFFALPGDPGPRFNPGHRSDLDGHDFIDAALANGAAGVVAHDGRPREAPQLQVGDTLEALWHLGAAARARLRGPVVAVTGSSGKTTAKGFLARALGAFATGGSLNNHLGVPLSLALTPRDASAAVYELGTNHPGEIAPLARLARPHVAVVLNVHPAHRANFVDMAALLGEKLSIHEGLEPGGALVLEASLDVRCLSLREGVRVCRFGNAAEATVALLERGGDHARYRLPTGEVRARVPGGGAHRAATLAAVLCVLHSLGRDLEPALALPDELVPAGRGRAVAAGGITVLDDSYNANPESMRAALASLSGRQGRRRFALLGEMLELGEQSARFHRQLAEAAGELDGVFGVGAGMEPLMAALPEAKALDWRPEADAALIDRIAATLGPGDLLLVKGSNRVFWSRDFVRRLVAQLGEQPVA